MPVVITGLTDTWPAQQQWTPKRLLEQYREHRFKVGANTVQSTQPKTYPQPTYRAATVADTTWQQLT